MADQALEGSQAYNARDQQLIADAATQARINAYGPIAGDPENAQRAQAYSNALVADPLANQTTQLTNTGLQLKNQQDAAQAQAIAAYKAAQLLKASANPDGSIPPDAFDQVVAPNAAMLGITDPSHVPQLKALLTAPGGAAHLDTISQALLGPQKTVGGVAYGTDANGNPVAILNTATGTIERSLNGTTPTVVENAGTSQDRAATAAAGVPIRQQQANTASYRAGVAGANQAYAPAPNNLQQPGLPGGAVAPAQAPPGGAAAAPAGPAASGLTNGVPTATLDKLLQQGGGLDGAISILANKHLSPQAQDSVALALANRYEQTKGTSPQQLNAQVAGAAPAAQAAAPVIPPTSTFAQLTPKGRQEPISAAQGLANQASILQTTNQLLDSVDHTLSSYTAGPGVLLTKLPGSAATDLKANLESIKAAGLTAWINSLKNSKGQTGIGRVLQSEANAATSLLGNMEQDQSSKQLAVHAQLFRRTINSLYQHSQQGFTAQWGVTPEAALGQAKPFETGAPSAQPGANKIYTYNPKTGALE